MPDFRQRAAELLPRAA